MDHEHPIPADSLAQIIDLAEDAIVSVDQDRRIILFNRAAEEVFQYSAAEVADRPLDLLFPMQEAGGPLERIHISSNLPATGRLAERGRIRGRRKDGTEFPAEASLSAIGGNGSTILTVILRDATERAAVEDAVLKSLREKEDMLREIHHRVKNNLQIVASLIGLQARSSTDDRTRKLLLESQNRVHIMALLHEYLYESQNVSEIDVPRYLGQLVSYLWSTHAMEPHAGNVRLETQLDPLYVDLDTAVACGLILNELVSNSLQHAFPGGRDGVIRIELRAHLNRTIQLVVADNGVGLVNFQDLDTTLTLGLPLVRSLAAKLGGTIEMRANQGMEARLTFPLAALTR